MSGYRIFSERQRDARTDLDPRAADTVVCDDCGALVFDQTDHDAWHYAIDRRFDDVYDFVREARES